jgi:hypothetical protein
MYGLLSKKAPVQVKFHTLFPSYGKEKRIIYKQKNRSQQFLLWLEDYILPKVCLKKVWER